MNVEVEWVGVLVVVIGGLWVERMEALRGLVGNMGREWWGERNRGWGGRNQRVVGWGD